VDRFDASTPAVTSLTFGTSGLASWSGYAQADPTLVGVVVAAIAIFAVVFVLKRVLGERRPGRAGGPRPGSKPARARSR
jgi:divalent metal cation (Fe/Co/Zn/Cd) transporter